MSRETDPDLNDVFTVAFEREQAMIRTIVPAHVTAFSRNPRECSIEIDMLAVLRSGDTLDVSKVDKCPIVWPVGGGFAMDADLAIGEQVLALVCDRDISGWIPTGAVQQPTRRLLHNITNAVVLPGLRSINRQGRQAPAAGELYLGADTGQAPWVKLGTVPPSATVEAPSISLGEGATLGVARQTDPVTPDAAWLTWFATVAASLNSLGFPAPLPIPPAGVPWATITTGSMIVRAK